MKSTQAFNSLSNHPTGAENIKKLSLILLVLSALLVGTVTAATPDIFEQENIEPPNGYVRQGIIEPPAGYQAKEEDNRYVLRGDGISKLKAAASTGEHDDGFLKDWFYDDVIAYLELFSHDLSEEKLTSVEAHEWMVTDMKSKWGKYSFSTFDPDSGIGWFVNYVGALVAVGSIKIGDTLYVVESQNLVEVLLVDELTEAHSQDATIMWERYRKAANADDTEEVLLRLKAKAR